MAENRLRMEGAVFAGKVAGATGSIERKAEIAYIYT